MRIKKVQRVFNTVVYSGLLFVMLMQSFLFDGWTHWAESARFFVDSNGMLQLAFYLACLATILEISVSGPRALLAAIMIIIPRVFTITHQNTVLVEMVLLASLSNLNSKKQNIYVWMTTHIIYGALLICLNMLGQISPILTQPKPTFGLQSIGSSYGMGHPNSFALFIMSTIMMLWVILKKHLRWWMTFLLFFATSIIVFCLTLCRTVAIIMILFPIIYMIIEALYKTETKWLKNLLCFTPLIMMVITLIISLYVVYISRDNIDINMSVRFYNFRYILEEHHMPFGSFNAIKTNWAIYFDNLYLMFVACCGYIPTVVALGVCYAMMKHLSKQKDIILLSITVVFLLYGMMENAMIYSIYFFVPILAFANQKIKDRGLFDITEEKEINTTGGIIHG